MEIKIEEHLFEWCKTRSWSGGKNASHYFTIKEIDEIEEQLEELYPEGLTETEINDLFWFDTESLCDWIGISYEDWEEREKQW